MGDYRAVMPPTDKFTSIERQPEALSLREGEKKRNVQLVHGTFFINSHESLGVVGVHHGCFGLIAGLRPGP